MFPGSAVGSTKTVRVEVATPFPGGVTGFGSKVVLMPRTIVFDERVTASLKFPNEYMNIVEVSEPPCGIVKAFGDASMIKSGIGGGLFEW